MSEVIFKCPTCSKNLSAGDTAIGRSFNCPTCQNKVTLPEPDFSFNCPSCNSELSSQKSMVGETFDCPSCEQGFTIPSTGKLFIQPLKQKTISITCPSCSVELELENSYYKEMEGKSITCPECNKAIPISSTTAPKTFAIAHPQIQIPASPKCPGCNVEMPKDAVICVHCGMDLRTGQKLSPEPEIKSRLKFKSPEPQSVDTPNSLLDRFPMPQFKETTIYDKILPVLKSLALLVVIAGVGLAVLYYVDISAVINKVKGIWASDSSKVATNKTVQVAVVPNPVVTNTVVKPPELKVVNGIIRTLETLRGKPADSGSMKDLSTYIADLTDSNDVRNIKCGMKTVFALAQMGMGNEQSGLAGCNHIQVNYADTEFAGIANKNNFYDPCQQCQQKGEIQDKCKVCSGNTNCKVCGGSGTRQVVKTAPQGLARAMGKSVRTLGNAPATTTVNVPCSSCNGSGKCLACRGIGFFSRKCDECNGAGKLLSKIKVKAQYDVALTKTLNQLTARQKEGKDLELVETETPQVKSTNSPDLVALKELLIGGSKVNLFDALIRVCDENKLRFSIDPEALGMMAGIYVETSSLSSVTNTVALSDFLSKYRLIVKQSPLSSTDTNRIDFVTTQSVWTYSQASWYLLRNQVGQAYQALNTATIESSEFGSHCQRLKELLQIVSEKKKELATISRTFMEALTKYKDNMRTAQTFESASRNGLRGPGNYNPGYDSTRVRGLGSQQGNDVAANAAESGYRRAENNALTVVQSLELFLLKTANSNKVVWERFEDAYNARLYSEAYFLLNYLIENYSSIRKMQNEVKASGLVKTGDVSSSIGNQDLVGDMPDAIKQWQSRLGEMIRLAVSDIDKLNISFSSEQNSSEGFRISTDAFTRDRANIMARVGSGYFTVLQHIKAIKDILNVDKLSGSQQMDIARDFRAKKKAGFIRAYIDATGNNIPSLPEDLTAKMGSAVGLAVVVAQGQMLPLSVRLRPVSITTVEHQKNVYGYWGMYTERYYTQEDKFPISFGDYGEKDIYMWMSAVEVYKWLCNQYPTEMGGQGLHIEFQELLANKGGDSAGVTMGIAGYSFLTKKPILRDIAMTGSIRSDGSVHAVGGIFEKISGAQESEGVEMAILPKANEADVLFVPIDQLCQISIILADDIQTYINYATDPDYKKDILRDLRKAQVLILLGSRKEAEDILLNIAINNPEIYTAKRLLELVAIHKNQ